MSTEARAEAASDRFQEDYLSGECRCVCPKNDVVYQRNDAVYQRGGVALWIEAAPFFEGAAQLF